MTEPGETPGRRPSAEGTPADPYVRYDARVLDPVTAHRLPDGTPPATTSYVTDRLVVTARSLVEARELVASVGAGLSGTGDGRRLGVVRSPLDLIGEPAREPVDEAEARLARLLTAADQLGLPLVFGVQIGDLTDDPGPRVPVDVWPLLLRLRSTDERLAAAVGLDHLMISSALVSGNPFPARGMALVQGSPFSARGFSSGVATYVQAGSGGHGPVTVVLDPPRALPGEASPRVVVLDTGVGRHPWFDAVPVQDRLLLAGGDPVGVDVDDPAAVDTDPEAAGAVPDPMTGLLGSHAGHGTFIAGLLRQTCPSAEIVAVRVMGVDGTVPETELAAALLGVAVRVRQDPPFPVHALVLSLGYYAETGADLDYTAGIKVLLAALGESGVTVFAAAGNDSSRTPMFPAAFAATGPGDTRGLDCVVAVAAENPDGSDALFSNDGAWVRGRAPGANVVSTVPVTQQGGGQADDRFPGPFEAYRGTIDPDDYSSGFGTWSGTSFAAPVLAGRYLAALARSGLPLDTQDAAARTQWRALVPLAAAAASGEEETR
ncbi:S8 family peptidase [Nakamurella endophytica]|uniref:Peptidase S8 n=1 Tax=Nakamurella endophytica TaxID=1748367 RepID=A0A917SPM6_9ACTN|nr:S8/S53 family peptidase [Nakamurella endophytica]GGL91229.1 peptidase S8 [Nakamurella endophytica]